MTGARIYLARHGQTYFSLEQRLGGNSELTPLGFEQAEQVSRWLERVPIGTIYSSTLKRSVQTAEVVHKLHPETILIQRPEIDEMSPGDLDSKTYLEFKEQFPDLFLARQKDKYHWCFPNGESYESALERARSFLDTLRSERGNIALVGHQGMNRIILGHLLDLPKTEIPHLVIPHDIIFVIDLTNKKVSYLRDGNLFEGYQIPN